MSTNEPNAPDSFPSLFGCIRLPFWALFQTLKSPLALLLMAGIVVTTAAVKVADAHVAVAKALDHQPLAAGVGGKTDLYRNAWEGRFLLADVQRVIEAATVRLEASPMLVVLLFMFFAGGILSCIGIKTTRRLRISDLLAESGRFFFRSFRTWVLFFVSLVVWNWVLRSWVVTPLRGLVIQGGEDTRQIVFAIAAGVVWGLGLAILLAVRRLSLARLVLRDQRSAVLAFFGSLGLIIRRPLRTLTITLVLVLTWAIGMAAIGIAIDRLFETNQLLPVLLVGIGGAVFSTACTVASFVLARRIWTLDGEVEPAREPTVVLPRAKKKEESEAGARVPVER